MGFFSRVKGVFSRIFRYGVRGRWGLVGSGFFRRGARCIKKTVRRRRGRGVGIGGGGGGREVFSWARLVHR